MDASLLQATTSAKLTGMLGRWLAAFGAEAPADPALLSNRLTASREIRKWASAQAEMPPLPSH